MRPLFTSLVCGADCDLPREQRASASKPAMDDLMADLWARAGLTPPTYTYYYHTPGGGTLAPPPPAPTQSVAPPTGGGSALAFDVGDECWAAYRPGYRPGVLFWGAADAPNRPSHLAPLFATEAAMMALAYGSPGAYTGHYRVRVDRVDANDDSRQVVVLDIV